LTIFGWAVIYMTVQEEADAGRIYAMDIYESAFISWGWPVVDSGRIRGV